MDTLGQNIFLHLLLYGQPSPTKLFTIIHNFIVDRLQNLDCDQSKDKYRDEIKRKGGKIECKRVQAAFR